MKCRLFSFILLIFLIFPLWGNEISEKLFLPQKYYVGDFVELRLVVRTSDKENVVIPENYPNEDWLEFVNIKVLDHHEGVEIRIVFRTFYPGTRTLPTIDFGAFLLEKVKIYSSSVLPETEPGFSGPRGQLYLPGTEAIIVLMVFVFLVIPLFFLFLAGWLKKALKKLVSTQREKKPIKKFYRTLDDLKKQAGRISSRDFYTILTKALRRYFTLRSGKDYQTITTKEIDSQIISHFPGIYRLQDLVEVLRYGDEIKFSPRRASYYKEIRDIDLILRVVNSIEDWISGKKGKEEASAFNAAEAAK